MRYPQAKYQFAHRPIPQSPAAACEATHYVGHQAHHNSGALLKKRYRDASMSTRCYGTERVSSGTRPGDTQDVIHRKNMEYYRKLLAWPDMDQAMPEYGSKLLADEEWKERPKANQRDDE